MHPYLPQLAPGWPRERLGPNFFPILISALAATLISLYPRTDFARLPTEPVVWFTFAFLCVLARLLVRKTKALGDNPWCSAVSMAAVWMAFRYGFGALIVYYWDIFPWESVPGLKQRFMGLGARQNLEIGCQLILIGGLGFFCGALIPVRTIGRVLPELRWPIDQDKFARNVVLYTPIAVVMVLYVSPRLPVALQFVTLTLGQILFPLIAIATYWRFTATGSASRAKWSLFLMFVTGLAVTFGLIAAMVGQIMMPIAMIVLGYLMARRAIPWKSLAVIGPIAIFVIAPMLTVYKHVGQMKMSSTSSVEGKIAMAKDVLDRLDYRTALELTAERFLARMAMAEFVAIFGRYYPYIYPYDKGGSFAIELSSLVPRVILPDKPVMSLALNNYSIGVGLVNLNEIGSNSAVFDAFSEYNVNFGPAGVFFFAALHAYYLKLLYHWMRSTLPEAIAGSLSLTLFVFNMDFFGVFQLFVSHVKVVPLWLFMLYLMSRRANRTAESGRYNRVAFGWQ